ncbi:MAG: class I SAM-dependent methyltransferase [Desulfomonile tiedjei]|nr:class I SAM-dependent methyltransferase [Desulfomonile tiedjei]
MTRAPLSDLAGEPTAGPCLPSAGFGDRRSVDYYTGVRHDVVAMIPEGVRSILEIGCAAGGTGRLLRSMGFERLIGVELDPYYASSAREFYSNIIVGDAEEMDLHEIKDQSLDCILYPDVLEHFRDPWAVLRRHLRVLAPGGYVIASIPNIRYYKAVRDLVLRGKWEYSDAGILDRGHLRFFTLASIQALFTENGLQVLEWGHRARGSNMLKLLNKVLLNRLSSFLVKQYLVLGQKPRWGQSSS